MIEDGSKRMDCQFCYSHDTCLRWQSNPRFKSAIICSENLSIAFLKKKNLRLNQNWAVGFSILELSKLHMMELYYDVIQPTFNNEVSVLLSDTDSYVLAVKTSSPDEAAKKLAPYMDFSNYAEDHDLYDCSRKNVVGLLKNEEAKTVIRRLVALKAKTYTYQTKEGEQKSRSKGVNKNYRKFIRFFHYMRCLCNSSQHTVLQRSLQSKRHKINLVESKKVAFSSFDDKRYLTCAIHSVPYGSVLSKKYEKSGMCLFCENISLLV